jgi:hypothetical protein
MAALPHVFKAHSASIFPSFMQENKQVSLSRSFGSVIIFQKTSEQDSITDGAQVSALRHEASPRQSQAFDAQGPKLFVVHLMSSVL